MKIFRSERLGGASVAAILAALAAPGAALAQAATYNFDIPSQDLGAALRTFAREAHQQISFNGAAVSGKQSPALNGAYSADDALRQLLSGSGLNYHMAPSGVWIVGPSGAAGGAAEAAVPPSAGESTATVEAVVVTGTNIRGGVTASPVTTYDRKAIEQSGFIDTTSFLNTLPQNWAGTTSASSLISHPDQRSDAQAGENGANLHGLGPRATLTLIDGHRLAAADFGRFTDLNAIPLSAVDRIDVLSDGASALYGADAVAGVVNFVLRKRMDGAETLADIGGVTDGGMRQNRLAQSFGLNWAGGSAIVSFDYNDQTALRASSRSFTPPAAADSDLTPRQFVRSIFAHATQSMNQKLDFYFTGLATHRTTTVTSAVFGGNYTDADETVVLGGAHYQINRRWDIDLSLDASGYRDLILQRYHGSVIFNSTANTGTSAAEILINGRPITLPAGDVKVALGGEQRHETYGTHNNAPPGGVTHEARNIGSLFTEVDIPIFSSANARPLLQELTFIAAGRWEHYSDFGDTANPKFGLRWKPEHELLLRATNGTSFNAPTLRERHNQNTEQSIVFPEADPLLPPGGMTNVLIIAGYGPNLRPETARTKTFGADYQPDWLKGLKLSATWYETRYSNRLAAPPGTPFAALTNPLWAGETIRNPTVAQIDAAVANTQYIPYYPLYSAKAIAFGQLQNLTSEVVKGWDLAASYSQALGAGNLTLAFDGAHIDSFMVKLTPGLTPSDVADTSFNPVKWKTRTSASWAWREWTIAGSFNTVGSYTNNLVPAPYPRVKAYNTVDGQIGYRFDTPMQPLSGLQLSLSIVNLFDTQPPAVAGSPSGFDPTNASPLGRVWTVSLRKRW